MTLLFDQNISFRIIKKIEDIFPGSISVLELSPDNWRMSYCTWFGFVRLNLFGRLIANVQSYTPL